MARGFLSGAIWGTVLSVAGLGAVSVLSPMPPQSGDMPRDSLATAPEPTGIEPDVTPEPDSVATAAAPAEPEVEPEPKAEPEQVPEPDPQPEAADTSDPTPDGDPDTNPDRAPEAIPEPVSEPGRRPADVAEVDPDTTPPGLTTPQAGSDTAPDTEAGAPTPLPETGEAVGTLAAPEGQEAPGLAIASDSAAPQAPSPAPELATPQGEIGLSVSTEPAQPPAPAIPEVQTALVPDAAAELPEPDAEVTMPESAEPPTTEADASGAATEQDSDAPERERPPVRRLLPDPGTDAEADETDTTALARPGIGKPAASLVDRPATSSRLPTIGAAEEEPEGSDRSSSAQADTPLQRFAAEVDVDPALPRMAIVLIDDGKGPLGPDTLETFPFPVTFALDPAQPGAADRMAAYRAQGFEVAVLASVPAAATPSDVEQLLAGTLAMVPEAVALVEAPGSGLQDSRSSTEQVASFAAETGHGLVFLPNGLNTAEAMARRENVAALSVLRDFDGDGQDARTKRRFLDGGAFRARQDGQAVMLGRLSPDTLSALVLWSLQDRASSVAMVPVSNILRDSLD